MLHNSKEAVPIPGSCKMTASMLSLAGSSTNISQAVKFLTEGMHLEKPTKGQLISKWYFGPNDESQRTF